MRKISARCLGVLCGAVLWATSLGAAFAADPENVTVSHKICNLPDNTTLPNGSGQFICGDSDYSGNAGKNWNELDLVPLRLELTAKNSAPATQTYTLSIVVDREDVNRPGFDFLSVPVLNAAKSDTGCLAPTVVGAQQLLTPGSGGTDVQLYRLITFSQANGKSCVYDYYARLALGSHLYPGASLHANVLTENLTSGGIGNQDRSIPVNEISPQALSKDMAASQGTDHTWNVTKSPTSANLSFGDVCRADAPASLPVQITVSWTKSPAIAGEITVTTNVYATNPAARAITTTVTDVIYSGTTVLDTSAAMTKDVPANTANFLMLTHSKTVPAGTTNLNDIATATYTDLVTGIPVPGSTTAIASAPVQQTGPAENATAVITDLEQITGTGLTYSVATPSLGSFLGYPLLTDPAYVAGTQTNGFVNWGTTSQPGDGSVTFDKTVYLASKQITTGTLSDAASLIGSSGYAATSGPVAINISSTASATLTIDKSYSGLTLSAGERLVFNFKVTRNGDTNYSADASVTLTGGGSTSGSTSLSGLTPDIYVVTEQDTLFYSSTCNDPTCAVVVALQDPSGAQKTADLNPVNGIATCTGAVSYANVPQQGAFPSAAVQKLTVPNTAKGTWSFTLKRPDGTTAATQTAAAQSGYVDFGVALNEEGTYTVVETLQPPEWVLTSATPNDGTDTKTCSFTVNFPQDLTNKVFQCTFTNTQQGKVQVIKTEKGGAPTQAFTFQLRQGASTTAEGTTLETLATSAGNGTLNFATWLVPNATYQMCEQVMPGWSTNLAGDGQLFVPGSVIPPSLPNPNVNNMTVCTDFSVAAGQNPRTFTVDNSPPPGGRALTIGFWRNWASCAKSSGKQAPVLDQTMAKAEPTGIQVDSFYLHGSTLTPDKAPDCAKAVNLLSKRNYKGVNKASDPLFNMAAQLVAAELNLVAGAYSCPPVVDAIGKANALLTKYSFNGTGYTGTLSALDATDANNYAKRLDDYNNNRASACQ